MCLSLGEITRDSRRTRPHCIVVYTRTYPSTRKSLARLAYNELRAHGTQWPSTPRVNGHFACSGHAGTLHSLIDSPRNTTIGSIPHKGTQGHRNTSGQEGSLTILPCCRPPCSYRQRTCSGCFVQTTRRIHKRVCNDPVFVTSVLNVLQLEIFGICRLSIMKRTTYRFHCKTDALILPPLCYI
jgi:hypothetical protein